MNSWQPYHHVEQVEAAAAALRDCAGRPKPLFERSAGVAGRDRGAQEEVQDHGTPDRATERFGRFQPLLILLW